MLRNLPFVSRKTETIDFKEFLKGNVSNRKRPSVFPSPIYSFFIPLHPSMFIDTTFLAVAAGVVAVALLERALADHGHVAFAEAIYTFLKLSLPIVGFAAMYFLISQLSF